MYVCMYEQMNGWMDELMNENNDWRINEWMAGWTNEWMNEWMEWTN